MSNNWSYPGMSALRRDREFFERYNGIFNLNNVNQVVKLFTGYEDHFSDEELERIEKAACERLGEEPAHWSDTPIFRFVSGLHEEINKGYQLGDHFTWMVLGDALEFLSGAAVEEYGIEDHNEQLWERFYDEFREWASCNNEEIDIMTECWTDISRYYEECRSPFVRIDPISCRASVMSFSEAINYYYGEICVKPVLSDLLNFVVYEDELYFE